MILKHSKTYRIFYDSWSLENRPEIIRSYISNFFNTFEITISELDFEKIIGADDILKAFKKYLSILTQRNFLLITETNEDSFYMWIIEVELNAFGIPINLTF